MIISTFTSAPRWLSPQNLSPGPLDDHPLQLVLDLSHRRGDILTQIGVVAQLLRRHSLDHLLCLVNELVQIVIGANVEAPKALEECRQVFHHGIPKDTPAPERNAFMQLKLRNAEQVLEGIALADFDRIEGGAESLIRLSKKADFQMGAVPGYEQHSRAFREAAEELLTHAKAKNLDGAALSYVRLTLNCVSCHKELRKHQRP